MKQINKYHVVNILH